MRRRESAIRPDATCTRVCAIPKNGDMKRKSPTAANLLLKSRIIICIIGVCIVLYIRCNGEQARESCTKICALFSKKDLLLGLLLTGNTSINSQL